MNLATRISRISVSKTMAVMEAAIKLRDQGIDVVDFGPGEPDFPTPENVKQAAMRAIQADFTKYTAIGGIKELKKAIVEKHAREFGSKYDVSECVVNMGGKHALFNIFEALVEAGDDVIIPTPYWVTFADIARFVNSNPIFLSTKESDGFRLTAEALGRMLFAFSLRCTEAVFRRLIHGSEEPYRHCGLRFQNLFDDRVAYRVCP